MLSAHCTDGEGNKSIAQAKLQAVEAENAELRREMPRIQRLEATVSSLKAKLQLHDGMPIGQTGEAQVCGAAMLLLSIQ